MLAESKVNRIIHDLWIIGFLWILHYISIMISYVYGLKWSGLYQPSMPLCIAIANCIKWCTLYHNISWIGNIESRFGRGIGELTLCDILLFKPVLMPPLHVTTLFSVVKLICPPPCRISKYRCLSILACWYYCCIRYIFQDAIITSMMEGAILILGCQSCGPVHCVSEVLE